MEGKENYEREEIFSKSVRAGRRTYFFDVRSTRAEDYYMTITESKKFSNDDGSAPVSYTHLTLPTKRIV